MKKHYLHIALLLLLTSPAYAESDNVKGGFFSKDTVSSGVFDAGSSNTAKRERSNPSPDPAIVRERLQQKSAEEENSAEANKYPPSYDEFQAVVRSHISKKSAKAAAKAAEKKKFRKRRTRRAGSKYIVDRDKYKADIKHYSEAPIVSVLLKVEELDLFKRDLEKLNRLFHRRRVSLGSVFLVDLDNRYHPPMRKNLEAEVRHTGILSRIMYRPNKKKPQLKNSRPFTLLGKMGFSAPKKSSADQLIERLGVRHSPTWVVEHQGYHYVFEGNFNPERFFSKDGRFVHAREDYLSGPYRSAQLADSGIRIVHHEVKRNSRRFSFDKKGAPKNNRGFASTHWSAPFAIRAFGNRSPARFVLETCSRDQVRRVKLDSAPADGFETDVLYYSAEKISDSKAAENWEGIKYAYPKLDTSDPSYDSSRMPHLHRFAEIAEIQCLPTRYQVLRENDSFYRLYREGSKAWQKHY